MNQLIDLLNQLRNRDVGSQNWHHTINDAVTKLLEIELERAEAANSAVDIALDNLETALTAGKHGSET